METKTPGLNEYVKDTKTRTGPKTTPPKKTIGLNEYVKSITPEVFTDGTKTAERGIFVCQKGHTFHATFSREKNNLPPPHCPKCNIFAFKLNELIKTKEYIFGVAHHLKMPDMSVPLRFLVETSNRRNAAAELARQISKVGTPGLERIAENLFDTDDGDAKFLALLDLVSKTLHVIIGYNEAGNIEAANTIKAELVGVLNGN